MNELQAQGWYQSLIDDCQAIITEAVWNSRWELIIGHHKLGERIVTDENYQRYSNGNGRLLSRLSENIGVSERDLYRSIQFYTQYPIVENLTKELPDGKNISWNKIANKILPSGDAKSHPGKTIEMCLRNIRREVDYIQEYYPDWADVWYNSIAEDV